MFSTHHVVWYSNHLRYMLHQTTGHILAVSFTHPTAQTTCTCLPESVVRGQHKQGFLYADPGHSQANLDDTPPLINLCWSETHLPRHRHTSGNVSPSLGGADRLIHVSPHVTFSRRCFPVALLHWAHASHTTQVAALPLLSADQRFRLACCERRRGQRRRRDI